jgi:hypothetical protein
VRNLSPASLAAIQATSGVEPAIVLRIFWGGSTYISYCDRKFETEGLLGKLLQISGIEDVVDINAATSSVNLSVTLDDSDGALKSIYNTTDIHKVYVQVLQWFTGIPLSEAFIIFEGEISSPIVWSEGVRTLKFDIVTKLEDREVGFSVEEGAFAFMPANLVGKAWPVIFGTVHGSKLMPLNESPTAVLASGFAVVDDDLWEEELSKLETAVAAADRESRIAYDLGIQAALKASEFKAFLTNSAFADDPSQADQYDQQATQYYAQSEQYAQDHVRLSLELDAKREEYDFQKSLEFRVLPITQTNLPAGNLTVEINNWTANVTIVGQAMIIHSITEKVDPNKPLQANNYDFLTLQRTQTVNGFDQTSNGQKFTWFDGGTDIKIFNFPRYYIASIGFVNVLNVWGTNKYGKAVIPRSWYTVDYTFFGSLPVTRIIFPTPLESYPGGWQVGDAEMDAVGTLGSNAVDIMIWAIQTFSGFTYDNDSFVYVRNKVAAMPMNFVLDKRMNVVQFLKEIAFQARCAIWLNDRRFYLRFLPEELAPVETITDSDIEVGTLILTSDETESLVTKFTAIYKENENQKEPSKIIFRYNIGKYGTNAEEYDFFAYTNREFVEKAAEFWMIRKSNSWKRLQCKVFLNKLRIEAFDPVEVTLSENAASTGSVTGLVTKATFNPDDDSVNLEIWLPVRLGEMTQYTYAFPGSVSDIYPNNADANIITGNPWQDAHGEIIPAQYLPNFYQLSIKRGQPWFTSGTGLPANQDPEQVTGFTTQILPSELFPQRPEGITAANDQTRRQVVPVVPSVLPRPVPGSFFATVISPTTTNTYSCTGYLNGLSGATTLLEVKIGFVPTGEVLPEGYPLIIHRTVFLRAGVSFVEWVAQPPLWVPYANPTV